MEQVLPPMHLVCDNDELRPNAALIQIKNGCATATNAQIIVRVDLKINSVYIEQFPCLEGKYIHMEVWKDIHKCESLEFAEDGITCHKNGIVKYFDYAIPNGEFFNIQSIIDQVKKDGEEEKRLITYSPKLISIIHKIFNSHTLHFSFTKGNNGTVVFPDETSGMMAILMPAFAEGVNRYFV